MQIGLSLKVMYLHASSVAAVCHISHQQHKITHIKQFVPSINTNTEFAKLNHITYFPSPLLMLAAGKTELNILQMKLATSLQAIHCRSHLGVPWSWDRTDFDITMLHTLLVIIKLRSPLENLNSAFPIIIWCLSQLLNIPQMFSQHLFKAHCPYTYEASLCSRRL